MTIPCSCCPTELEPRCWNDGVGGSGVAVAHLCCVPIIGATYEIDWSYAHMNRSGSGVQTAQLRIGDAANPLGTNPIVSTHVGTAAWQVQSGTAAIGAGFPQIRMEFQALTPAGGAGNLLDACSIILRRVTPTPANFGEQLVNGSFEVPAFGANTVSFPATTSPGIGWSTTDPCNCLEIWHNNFGGQSAFVGTQMAEMNAFVNATLFQNASLETCDNVITWFDTATGDVISPGLLVDCPASPAPPPLFTPLPVSNLTMNGAAFGDGPDAQGENICNVAPAPTSTTNFSAPVGGCYDPTVSGSVSMTWAGPLSSVSMAYGNLPRTSGGVVIGFTSPATGVITWPVNNTPMVPGESRLSNPLTGGGYAVFTYVSGPSNTNAPRMPASPFIGVSGPIGMHLGSTEATTPAIAFRLDFYA